MTLKVYNCNFQHVQFKLDCWDFNDYYLVWPHLRLFKVYKNCIMFLFLYLFLGGRGTRGLYPGSNEDAEQHDLRTGR